MFQGIENSRNQLKVLSIVTRKQVLVASLRKKYIDRDISNQSENSEDEIR